MIGTVLTNGGRNVQHLAAAYRAGYPKIHGLADSNEFKVLLQLQYMGPWHSFAISGCF